jgi:hypothetical protein
MPAARPQRIGTAGRSYVENGVGNIGWRDIDLVTADLGNAIDYELAAGRRAVGVPQLQLLVPTSSGPRS